MDQAENKLKVATDENCGCNVNDNVHIQISPDQFSGVVSDDSFFFSDGARSVDFVLVWKRLASGNNKSRNDLSKDKKKTGTIEKEARRLVKRKVFEENLQLEGLEMERKTVDDEIVFVKIHTPLEVLRRYAEILNLRMPLKEVSNMATASSRSESFLKKIYESLTSKITDGVNYFPPISHHLTAKYSHDKEQLFDHSHPTFFNSITRARIVQFILDRQRYSRDETHKFRSGINKLLVDETYIAAYPLHDGDIKTEGSIRHLLYTQWASFRNFWHCQPLDCIKDYFGVRIGIYFAWLGFYTSMLIVASVVGIISFLASLHWMNRSLVNQDICYDKGDIMMCPMCDSNCDYWKLSETCWQSKIMTLFDNPMTVFFSVFMSFWAILFLEYWKRYSADITHRWDLVGFDVHEEHSRPRYLVKLKAIRKHKDEHDRNADESNVPFWRIKLPTTILSMSMVLLLILLACVAVFGVVVYRMSVLAVMNVPNLKLSTSFHIIFISATAAVINLILIVILNYVYEYLAEWLTELELLRTQMEFDDSLTLKIYLLQFVSYYASIFYIAFFKGKFIGTPKHYTRVFNFRQEECGLGGCLMELTIQLAIIMIGKQIMNSFIDMTWTLIMKYYNLYKLKAGINHEQPLKSHGQRDVKDLKLLEFRSRDLSSEYLEMVLQFGFITLFSTVFPLAPLFALLNNICELRLDAKKILRYYRRPVLVHATRIGIWSHILDYVTKLAVFTNGIILAFTSDFVPRMVYIMYYSENRSLDGYIEFSLSKFNTSEFEHNSKPNNNYFVNLTECHYQDFRYGPSTPNLAYQRTPVFWNVMAARLLFVVIYENALVFSMAVVRLLVPDVSGKLRNQIRREASITNELEIQVSKSKARQREINHQHQN